MSSQEQYNALPKSPKNSSNRHFFQDTSSATVLKDKSIKDSVFSELRTEESEEIEEKKEISPKSNENEGEEDTEKDPDEEQPWDDLIVGIDLGTSTTKVAYQHGTSIIMIGNNANMPITPSVVAFRPKILKRTVDLTKRQSLDQSHPENNTNPEDTVLDVHDIVIDDVRVGQDALNAPSNKWYTIRASKRMMGVPTSFSSPKDINNSKTSHNNFNFFQKSKVSDSVNYSVISDHDGRSLIRVKTGKENGLFFDVYPQQVSAEVLSYVKKIYKNQFHTDRIRVVLSVPAYYTAIQRNMTMEAAKIAGIKVEMLVSEPIAAAIKYLYAEEISEAHSSQNSTNFEQISSNVTKRDGIYLIFDFGGGTLDVSLVEVSGKSFKVVGTEGDQRLGGADIDYLLFRHFLEDLWEKHEISLFDIDETNEYFQKKGSNEQEIEEITQKMKISCKKRGISPQDKILFRQKLLQKAEAVKESLTVYNEADILFEEFIQQENDSDEQEDESEASDSENQSNNGNVEQKLTLSRQQFEKLLENSDLKPRIYETIDLIFKTIKKSILPSDIYKVILVGGSCNAPLIKDWVSSYFKDKSPENQAIPLIVKPDQLNFAVSHGAAILANQKMMMEKGLRPSDDNSMSLEKFFNVNEILSHGIGVECTNDVFWTMISRFSPLPCKVSEAFSTSEDYNTTLMLEIKQGDSMKASENEDLISLVIKDLPARLAQQTKVLVTFQVDESGFLNVFASDLENENNSYHVEVKLKGKLSKTKIREMQCHGITTPIQGDGKTQEINEKYLLFREFARLVFAMEHYLNKNGEKIPLQKLRQYSENLEILLKYSNVYHSHQTLDVFKMVRLIKTVKRRIDDAKSFKSNPDSRKERQTAFY